MPRFAYAKPLAEDNFRELVFLDGSGTDPGEPYAGTETHWYTYRAGPDGALAVFQAQGNLDLIMAVYASSVDSPTFGDLTQLAYEAGDPPNYPHIEVQLAPLQKVWIQTGTTNLNGFLYALDYSPPPFDPPGPRELYAEVYAFTEAYGDLEGASAPLGDMAGVVVARASAKGGLAVVRHRLLSLFVTVGRSVDNRHDVQLAASVRGVREDREQAEVVTQQGASFG